MYTKTEYIEIFHLLFLSHLEKKMEKNSYVVKGGCNLRFFFKSIRYSEDIDFDIQTIAKTTLINKVDKILTSLPFKTNLKSKGIDIFSFSKPKQTDTTQRWKLLLKCQGLSLDIPTKIEFSRSSLNQGSDFGPVENTLIQHYKLYPILANHYNLNSAFNQKIQALIHRSETQARDVFDLKLIIEHRERNLNFTLKNKEDYKAAVDRIRSIRFGDFKSQVVAYLLADYQSYYDNENIWREIQEFVIQNIHFLEKQNEAH